MPDQTGPSPIEVVRPLLRTHQVREHTAEPITDDELFAVTEVARWSGSSSNDQPWRFLAIRDRATLDRLAALGLPSTRSLATAAAAVIVVLPAAKDRAISNAYDDGRAAERMLVAATMLGFGGAIAWFRPDIRAEARSILGIPDDWMVRTVVAFGHPTAAAARPKTTHGEARRPRGETVFQERWPATVP